VKKFNSHIFKILCFVIPYLWRQSMIRDDLEILTDEEVDTLIVSTGIFIFDY